MTGDMEYELLEIIGNADSPALTEDAIYEMIFMSICPYWRIRRIFN